MAFIFPTVLGDVDRSSTEPVPYLSQAPNAVISKTISTHHYSRSRELGKLYRLLLCFQSQQVPVDLISRACKPKATWSSSGEIVWKHPNNEVIPQWLIDVSESSEDLFKHDGAVPGLEGLEIVSQYGIRYFEFRDDSGLDAFNDTDDEVSTQQCIRAFIHAFPSRNTEILAEEVASRLLPLAKTFLLPFLAVVSMKDVASWFLPEARSEANERNVEWAICLLDCLQQISIHLGIENRLLPARFPQKLLDAFSQDRSHAKETQKYLGIFVDMMKLVKSPLPGSFDHFLTTIGSYDKRCNAWAGLSLGLLSSRALSKSQILPNIISQATMRWRPMSMTDPSTMEYLVATELLPIAQLSTIPQSFSLDIELSMVRGFLLARKGSHDEASRILFALFPYAADRWGEASYQVGIVVAECANCYNFLRREKEAYGMVTRCLATPRTPQLTNRPDWFYLNIALVDSLIGRGRYKRAASILEEVMGKPSIPPIIHMMSCLRLAKAHRRTHDQSAKAFQVDSPLWTGVKLFDKASSGLREEYLEELSCNLSTGAESTIEDLKAQEGLVHAVNDVLQQTPLINNLAQTRYAQAQQQLQQQIARKEGGAHCASITSGRSPLASCDFLHFLPPRNKNFIPRSELEALAGLLLRDSPAQHTVNVYGKVGIGKTSLVNEFVHSYSHHFDVILWIDCNSSEEVTTRMSKFAMQLGLVDKDPSKSLDRAHAREQLEKWLSFPVIEKGNCKKLASWLIVLDGVDDKKLVSLCQPTRQGGIFIAITRALKKWADCNTLICMEIGPLTTEQAVLFFPSHILKRGLKVPLPEDFTPGAKQTLVSILGNHPSAIIQATSFISDHSLTVLDFLDRYKEAQSSFSIPTEVSYEPHHHEALIMLWFLKNSHNSKSVLDILALIGTETPEDLLWPNPACTSWPKYPQDSDAFEVARNELIEASLVWTKSSQKVLVTSAAVQAFFRRGMATDTMLSLLNQAIDMLSYSWPCKFEGSVFIDYISATHTDCSSLWPCALSLANIWTTYPISRLLNIITSAKPTPRRVKVLLDISWCAIKRCLFNEASIFLNIARSMMPPSGWILRSEMRDYEARKSFITSYSVGAGSVARLFVNTNLIRAAMLNGLGKLSLETGAIRASIDWYEKSLKLLGRPGGTAEYAVNVSANLGFALLLNDQPLKAESYFMPGLSDPNPFRRAFRHYGLAIATLCQNSSFKENYHIIGDVYTVMSNSYAQQSMFKPATEHVDKALAVYEKEVDPSTAILAKVRLLRRQRSAYIMAGEGVGHAQRSGDT
ncbi:hypothetical protein NM208_g5950 [Fusarium decemcellulare]|uniref:Uncharacterized protein n=1 Tax=Fusarium decemcellulare TaxID=57161 RepID=A0ACC1SEZ1_9HYPO|nr:hypothetical protein NM208_g5950 [Fusarium decemcellulare]